MARFELATSCAQGPNPQQLTKRSAGKLQGGLRIPKRLPFRDLSAKAKTRPTAPGFDKPFPLFTFPIQLSTCFVGVRGFEPPASCAQGKRSNRAELHPDGPETTGSFIVTLPIFPRQVRPFASERTRSRSRKAGPDALTGLSHIPLTSKNSKVKGNNEKIDRETILRQPKYGNLEGEATRREN